MPRNGTDAPQQGQSFLEAIAHWRLAMHTEVKRASSLPTAMFDACDPMLESRLVESVEAMFGQLQDPAPQVAKGDDDTEQRLETVTHDELRALPALLAAPVPRLDLLAGLGAEYLAMLADTCCLATGTPQRRAVELLCRDFAVAPAGGIDQLTKLLDELVEEVVAGQARPSTDEELATTCKRVAAAVTLHAPVGPARSPQ